jgi:membrane protease YdiL (CAAX protease family)
VTHLPDHMLFVMLAVLFPIRAATFGYRRLAAADDADVPRVRLWLYRQIIAIQWSLAALVALLWVVFRRPWSVIGLKLELSPELIGVLAGLVIVVALTALQQRRGPGREAAYARVRERARHIERMLPHDRRELGWFSAVAVTAGICEELLYRGYLIWYLQHWLPLTLAVAAAVVIFGFGHFYQGPRGMLLTAIVGAFLAVVYLVTGTLFASMVIHALMDLYSGHAAWRAYRKPAA